MACGNESGACEEEEDACVCVCIQGSPLTLCLRRCLAPCSPSLRCCLAPSLPPAHPPSGQLCFPCQLQQFLKQKLQLFFPAPQQQNEGAPKPRCSAGGERGHVLPSISPFPTPLPPHFCSLLSTQRPAHCTKGKPITSARYSRQPSPLAAGRSRLPLCPPPPAPSRAQRLHPKGEVGLGKGGAHSTPHPHSTTRACPETPVSLQSVPTPPPQVTNSAVLSFSLSFCLPFPLKSPCAAGELGCLCIPRLPPRAPCHHPSGPQPQGALPHYGCFPPKPLPHQGTATSLPALPSFPSPHSAPFLALPSPTSLSPGCPHVPPTAVAALQCAGGACSTRAINSSESCAPIDTVWTEHGKINKENSGSKRQPRSCR